MAPFQTRRTSPDPRRHLARRHVLHAVATGSGAVAGSTLPLRHIERLIGALAADGQRSQRELARELGIALGLINQLLQLLLAAGWVRSVRQANRRVTYKPTQDGIDGGRRLARLHLQSCSRSYEELRAFVVQRLAAVAAATGTDAARLALFGEGSLTEIASLSPPPGVVLVGVVAEGPVHATGQLASFPATALDGNCLQGHPFDRIVIMSLGDTASAEAFLEARAVPPHLIEWL